jgi:outer membrane protein OmpA-like peptidoglycan-associated protein/tetratricopeptide (TPR) repeat protein
MKTITAIITVLIMIVFTSVDNPVNAQLSNRDKAKTLISNYEYVKAIALYNESFKSQTPSDEDLRNISYCYMQINDTKHAIEWLSKLTSVENPSPKDVMQYAHLLKTEAKYDEAITQYNRYKKMNPDDKRVNAWIESCNLAKQWINNPTYYQVTNLQELNSENSDFGLMPLGEGYIFTSDRKQGDLQNKVAVYGWTGNPYLKLYRAPSASNLKEISPISSLNGDYHNGPSTTLLPMNKIYFTRTKMVKVTKKNLNNDPTSWIENISVPEYENRLEMYAATIDKESEWNCFVDFPYNKPEEYSVGHPTLSPDGKVLYFVSDMPGGFGGTDIYYCMKTVNNTWSAPLNAGKTINTPGKELFPYMDKNGVLYFSSDGHNGMGGLDIYKSTGSRTKWTEPENMKYPVNSPKDDFSVYFDEANNIGYLSSNRDGGKGSDDIYKFAYTPPSDLTLILVTKEIDKKNVVRPLDGVDLKLTNKTNSASTAEFQFVDGKYISGIKCNNAYSIMASKDGYFSKSLNIDTTKCVSYHDTIFAEIVLVKLEIEVPIVLKNIYYDFDKSYIRPDAKPDLDKLVQIMKDNPNIIVELGSHCDARGSDNYNLNLSDHRAKSAVEYIISNGISKNRIKAKGYGEKMHLNNCTNNVICTEDEHQINRRTEFKVTGFINGKIKVINSKI